MARIHRRHREGSERIFKGDFMRRNRINAGNVIALALLMGTITLTAQVPTGTILGVVKDASGAGVPSAAVTIRNEDTAVTRQTTTGDEGSYQVPALPVGPYSVKFQKTGFAEQTQ